MARRTVSETGYYHITARSAGQIALFEGDSDRRRYLHLLKEAHDVTGATVIAWVLMTDHVHLLLDCADDPSALSSFMFHIDARYSRYFNAKTGRAGTLFQGNFWSKPILTEEQLIATVYYIHMNPEAAGLASMRAYRWSSYQEYAGKHWVVDTSTVIGVFGSFESFDAYRGSPKDVIRRSRSMDDGDAQLLSTVLELAQLSSSAELRNLPPARRNELIRELSNTGASARMIARVFGIGNATVSRILRKK